MIFPSLLDRHESCNDHLDPLSYNSLHSTLHAKSPSYTTSAAQFLIGQLLLFSGLIFYSLLWINIKRWELSARIVTIN